MNPRLVLLGLVVLLAACGPGARQEGTVESPAAAVTSPPAAVESPKAAVTSTPAAVESPDAVESPPAAVESPEAVESPPAAVESPEAAGNVTPGMIDLSSPAFAAGGPIPALYTCQGEDLSPALEWSAPPPGTRSLALVMEDPDAPGGTWIHWVVYNLPPETTGLAEGASRANSAAFDLPEGARQGPTSFRRSDYGGPCPPSGEHRYFFYLYALDIPLDPDGLDRAALSAAMQGHILAEGSLVGTYRKP